MSTVWLVRDGTGGVCWCNCMDPIASLPNPAGCPWCGCGWLIGCARCRKCFTFARAVERKESAEEIVRLDLMGLNEGGPSEGKEPSKLLMSNTVAYFRSISSRLKVGLVYVHLDTKIIPVDVKYDSVSINGERRRHTFSELPHKIIARNKGSDFGALGDNDYWLGRKGYYAPKERQ